MKNIKNMNKPKGTGIKPVPSGLVNVITGLNRASNPFSGVGKNKKGKKFSMLIMGVRK